MIVITLINGFVLISNWPNWDKPPVIKRNWETEIDLELPGGEVRAALRAVSRRSLTFTVTSPHLTERTRLESRIDAAKLSGLACAPLHGRMSPLGANANEGTDSLTLAVTNWNWQIGDYAILLHSDLSFDIQQVTNVAGLTLTLAGNLTNNWFTGKKVWPLIFGTLTTPNKFDALNAHVNQVEITITELTSARAAQLGVLPAGRAGIGAQVIGKTNQL